MSLHNEHMSDPDPIDPSSKQSDPDPIDPKP